MMTNATNNLRKTRIQMLVLMLAVASTASVVDAATVRIWPDAVVVDDSICIGDLCRLEGFDNKTASVVRDAKVLASPVPGGSLEVQIDDIRRALSAAGVNMASVVVRGSSRCSVMRPVDAVSEKPVAEKKEKAQGNTATSLRQAVTTYFAEEIGRSDGRVDIQFGRTAEQILDLSGPEFTFSILRRSPRLLGLVSVEVTIHREGKKIRTIPMALTVQYVTDVLVAARAINAKAPVQRDDLRFMEMTFDQIENLPMTELNRAVGQCAKKFIPPGTPIQLRNLEPVPLVRRGDTVEVISRSGGITVVTSGKALQSGAYGDSIVLKTVNAGLRSQTISAVVIGQNQAEVRHAGNSEVQLAGGVQ